MEEGRKVGGSQLGAGLIEFRLSLGERETDTCTQREREGQRYHFKNYFISHRVVVVL